MFMSHNPYFSRWFSAIRFNGNGDILDSSHNPYFSRWFSAIFKSVKGRFKVFCHNPYFSRWFSAIIRIRNDHNFISTSQSLF